MPQTVVFPSVSENIARAIQTVMAGYSNPDIQIIWNETLIRLPPCEIAYSIHRLQQPATKPQIVFSGSRVSNQRYEKVSSVNELLGFQYEFRCEPARMVFVRVSTEKGNENDAFLKASKIWDTLVTICAIRYDLWAAFGILRPMLDATPVQTDDKDSVVLHGKWECKLHLKMTRNASMIADGIGYDNVDLETLLDAFPWQGPSDNAPVVLPPSAGDTWPEIF